MNVVPCIAWVKRGAARRNPDKLTLNQEDLKRLIHSHGSQLEKLQLDDGSDEEQDVEGTPSASVGGKRKRGEAEPEKKEIDKAEEKESSEDEEEDSVIEDLAEKYGLDNYEDDEDEENPMGMDRISVFATNKDDPYIANEDDNSDAEETEILPEDSLVIAAKVHGDFNTLEVHVYEEDMSNMYCHHDLLLPTFPLAIEWLDFDPGESSPGNFVALGSMEPDIEIWDLDVLDCMEPAFVLAGASQKKGKKKKKKSVAGHTDAVLGLSWNRNQRQVLASASADFTVGIWDIQEGKMVSSIKHHEEKVQDVEWHPVEPQSLLSGSFDKTARVFDCRSPEDSHKSWLLSGEVEKVAWNLHDPYYFLASTDNGSIFYVDVRTSNPVLSWEAHKGAATGLCVDKLVPGCLVTVSADKSMKVWDIRQSEPDIVINKNMKMGELHCIASCPDSALLYAVGGETEHRVVNLKKNEVVCNKFGMSAEAKVQDRKTRRDEDSSDENSSDDDDDNDDDDVEEIEEPEKKEAGIELKKKKTKK